MDSDKWNEICYLLSENLPADLSENDFGQEVIQALRILDWKEYKGEIEKEHSLHFGSVNKLRPDFIIKCENKRLFVIEIKLPNIPINSTFQRQLFSYMRQLKLEYGILIGQGIQIFYDGNLVNQEDPILLETIQFTPDNEKGQKFVELFSKESYSTELLKSFTLNSLKKINRKEDHKKLTEKILSENFQEKLNELIKQDFLNEYDGELIDGVLSELKIEITSKNRNETKSNLPTSQFSRNREFNSRQTIPNSSGNKVKIGKYVWQTFKSLINAELMDSHEIEQLQKSDYSKRTFDIQYPFLRKILVSDIGKIDKYWKTPVIINGKEYVVCSEWYENPRNNDRPYYEKWLKNMKQE